MENVEVILEVRHGPKIEMQFQGKPQKAKQETGTLKITVESGHCGSRTWILCPILTLQFPKRTGSESPAPPSPSTFHISPSSSVPTQSISGILQNSLGFLSSLSLSSLSAIALSSFESLWYPEPAWAGGFAAPFCCSLSWFCLASKAATRLWQGQKKTPKKDMATEHRGLNPEIQNVLCEPNRQLEQCWCRTETTPSCTRLSDIGTLRGTHNEVLPRVRKTFARRSSTPSTISKETRNFSPPGSCFQASPNQSQINVHRWLSGSLFRRAHSPTPQRKKWKIKTMKQKLHA